jgi:hypothetical protein
MGRFLDWLTGKHKCDCGAMYQMATTTTEFPETSNAVCEVCGKVMDSWRESTIFRSYNLISRQGDE